MSTTEIAEYYADLEAERTEIFLAKIERGLVAAKAKAKKEEEYRIMEDLAWEIERNTRNGLFV